MFVAETSAASPGRPRIVATNAALRRLTGFRETFLRGRPLRSLYSMWTGANNRRRLLRAIDRVVPVRVRVVANRSDRSSFPAEWSMVPARREGGGILWTCAVRDESSRWLRERLTSVAAQAWDLPAALGAIQEAIRHDVGWAYSESWIATRDGRAVKPSVAGPHDTAALRQFREASHNRGFRAGEGIAGRVFERGSWEWVGDLAALEDEPADRRDLGRRAGLRSLLAVPVRGRSGVAAVMIFYGTRGRKLDRSLVDRIVDAVTHLGPVLERKEVEVHLRLRAVQQEAVARLGIEALAKRPELDGLLRQAARSVVATLEVDFCKVLELLPRRKGLLLRAGVGWPDGVVGKTVLGAGRKSHGGYALASREPVVVEDFARETRFEAPDLLLQHGVRSGISVLVHGPHGPWGVLGAHTTSRRRFGADDIHFLQSVANVLGTATARHHAEAQLERHRRNLERTVLERTRRLEKSHERLRQTERLASIGTLAAGLGHDMSNLLLPTLCRLDALDAAELPDGLREDLLGARRSLEYLRELSQGLRLLALDPDDATASTSVTDIYAWWKEVRPVLARVLPRGAELRAAFPAALPQVGIPKHQLTQAVLNLVLNAAEALEDGGRVLVSAARLDGEVQLSVADSGRGMTPEVLKRALDPFYSTKKRSLSTGLGLPLVRALAKRAGGSISVESAPGRGTRVVLRLAEATPRPVRDPGLRSAAMVRIDDPRTFALASRFLETNGYRVFSNGESEDCRLCVLGSADVSPEDARRLQGPGRRVLWLGHWPDEARPSGLVALDGFTPLSAFRRVLREVVRDLEESSHV